MSKVLFCFGLSYSAGVLAGHLAARGWDHPAPRASPRRRRRSPRAALAHRAVRARRRPVPSAALAGVTHVLTSIAPDAEGDPVLDRHAPDLAALPGASPGRAISAPRRSMATGRVPG
ncbi:MAG: hypothetical protein U1E17_08380 [Geminicoccaceae bacterium]